MPLYVLLIAIDQRIMRNEKDFPIIWILTRQDTDDRILKKDVFHVNAKEGGIFFVDINPIVWKKRRAASFMPLFVKKRWRSKLPLPC